MNKSKKPEWTPENAGTEFASSVVSGHKESSHVAKKHVPAKHLSLLELKEGVLANNRTLLSKAITLVESNSAKHFLQAQELITELLPHTGKSIRIGITGTPGAGKSTFIESFGLWLIKQGHRVAVLAIDPSSSISKGSILGDKTRMEELSKAEHSFIRPSPSGGVLGGVARKTRESIMLCEAAGYDTILIETVGVGQSEITVRSMVDFFLLIQISGAGDELQGIKKGIMELADLIVVNKADGDNILKAQQATSELNNVLHYLTPSTKGWTTKAQTCSALHKTGLQEIWNQIEKFLDVTSKNEVFETRRKHQALQWFEDMLKDALLNRFFTDPENHRKYESAKADIAATRLSPAGAVHTLLNHD